MSTAEPVFIAFGLTSQALLLLFFAARRWWPRRAGVLGLAAYGFGVIGLPIAIALAADGQAGTLWVGPLLMAVWSLFGATVDIWRPRPWRGPPVDWRILGPYVAVYFLAQMFMWWPLWNLARGAWVLFLVLFIANTALNLEGHRRPGSRVA